MTDNEVRLECIKLVAAHNTFPFNPERAVETAALFADFVLDPNCCKE